MTSGLDLDALVAIEVHVHVEQDGHGHLSLDAELIEAAERYFRRAPDQPTVDEIAAYYRARAMAAVVFTVDAEVGTGHPPLSTNENPKQLADALAGHPDYNCHRG